MLHVGRSAHEQAGCVKVNALANTLTAGYRYMPCRASPNVSPVSTWPFKRTIRGPLECPLVHISWLDRSSFLKMSSTANTVTTDRGFRSARANVAVRQGTWYYEVVVARGDGDRGSGAGTGGDHGNAHVRVGWGRREALLDAPVGADGYSYAIRDVGGQKVHLSRPKPYGKTFKTGDIIGCLISLPERHDDPETLQRKRIPIAYKDQSYFEMDEYGVQKEMEALVDREGKVAAAARAAAEAAAAAGQEEEKTKPSKKKKKKDEEDGDAGATARELPILPGSKVEFFLNGEALGTAFEDIYDFSPLPPIPNPLAKKPETMLHDDGTLGYYPMVSCFGRGKLQCNFGPEWRYPPTAPARPMSERYDEFKAEEVVLDERDEARETVRLKEELEEIEARRAAAEAKIAAAARRKANAAANKKKRKGTETPLGTPRGTPGGTPTPAPDDVKMERESVVSRAGTEEPVKVEEDGDVSMATHHAQEDGQEDPEEGVQWT